jgi:hypothetical protein
MRRTAAVLSLSLVLAGAVPAIAAHQSAPRALPADRAASVAQVLAALWQGLTATWGAVGAEVDPNGQHGAGTAPVGAEVDPNGAPHSDVGAEVDPNG